MDTKIELGFKIDKTQPHPLIGVALGDSAGAFCECKPKDDPIITGWDGKTLMPFTLWDERSFGKGSVTDDTEMTIALAESLAFRGGFDRQDVVRKYLHWHHNNPRGQGSATRTALDRAPLGMSAMGHAAVITGVPDAVGTGTAMRAHPLGIVYWDEELADICFNDAVITHLSLEAVLASWLVAVMTSRMINATKSERALGYAIDSAKAYPFHDRLLTTAIGNAKPNTALSLVMEAITCLSEERYSESVQQVIVRAVKMGGDTDTRAAIAGGWAAILWPESLPDEWLYDLEAVERLLQLEEQLFALRKKRHP